MRGQTLGQGNSASARGGGGGRSRRALLALATVLGLVALVVIALFVALSIEVGGDGCGGDGGLPYAALASPRGEYCASGLPRISLLVGLVLAGGGGALAAAGRGWRLLLACAVAGAALMLSPLAIAPALSKECDDNTAAMTDEQRERYSRERPECDHY